MEEKFVTVSTNDGIHKYPENHIWQIDEGYLKIQDKDLNDVAEYNIGRWDHVRKG